MITYQNITDFDSIVFSVAQMLINSGQSDITEEIKEDISEEVSVDMNGFWITNHHIARVVDAMYDVSSLIPNKNIKDEVDKVMNRISSLNKENIVPFIKVGDDVIKSPDNKEGGFTIIYKILEPVDTCYQDINNKAIKYLKNEWAEKFSIDKNEYLSS